MNPTVHRLSRVLLAPALLLGAVALAACARMPLSIEATIPDAARGEYLATRVGMCHDCHTPRGAQGEFLREKWLHGSVLPFAPTVAMPWTPAAPMIAGLPTLTDAQAVSFLTTGELPGGRKPRPPMPEFRFNGRDAADLVAYLRGLAPTTTKTASR